MKVDTASHIKNIREWISKQPHLPQNIHDNLLRRFLHSSKHSIEQTKYLIDLFYTIRSQAPEIFENRDPCRSEILETLNNIDFLPLPKQTDDKYRCFLYRILTNDPEKYNFIVGVKTFFICSDVRMVIEDDIDDGEIPIFDMKNFTLRHLTKIVLPVLKKYMIYTQEAHPITLKEIHILNVPSFLDRVIALVKPFLKAEVAKMVHFHHPNSDTLYDFVPKRMLPQEYGGEAGRCEDIKKFWIARIMENKDYLLDFSRWRIDESRRAQKSLNTVQLFGMEGSFRSLNID